MALIAAVLLTLIGGCSESPHRAGFLVSVSDATVAAQVAYVEVRILEDGCTGDEVYAAGFRPGTPAPAPPLLARGSWGFAALARDEGCNRIAFGCVEVDLPRSEAVEVVMDPVTPIAECDATLCDRGACGSGVVCDGGVCPPECDGGVCPPACDGGVCPPACDGGACPGLCDPYPEESCPVCEPTGFSTDLADIGGASGNDVSIAADALGRVHATYYASAADTLAYAWHEPEGYFVDALVDGEGGDLGEHADVEIDGEGGAHLVHVDRSTGSIRYLYQAPGSTHWDPPQTIEGIDDEAGVSLAVDEDGTAHVVAIASGSEQVLHAHAPLGGAWTTELVGPSDARAREADVAVERGTVHLLYHTDDAPFLQYGSRDAAGTWTFEAIAVPGVTSRPGQNLSLAVEPGGRVHAVFNVDGDRGLGYATRDVGGAWTSGAVPVPVALRIRGELGMAVAPSGDVHVTYYRDDGEGLSYVRRDPTGGWTAPTSIRSGSDAGQYSSIAVGEDGRVHVAFSVQSGDDLWYATPIDGRWTLAVAASPGDVGDHAAIAVDASGIVRIAHRDAAQRDLRVACRRPGGLWQTESASGLPGGAGVSSSIAIDASGILNVAVTDSAGQLRIVARSAGGIWSSETVDPGPGISGRTTMLFGPDGAQHLVYLSGSAVTYAVRSPGAPWTMEVVVPDEVSEVTLALGADGTPHVAYRSRTTSALLYARREDSGWLGAQIDPARGRGTSVVLAVARDGAVHAIYTDSGPGTLHHAELPAGARLDGWLAPVAIDSNDENGEDISVAFDGAGALHVLYTHGVPIIDPVSGGRAGTSYSLRYAALAGDGWSTPVDIDTRDGAGQRVAVVVDALGRLHGVYNRSQPGLLHVWKSSP